MNQLRKILLQSTRILGRIIATFKFKMDSLETAEVIMRGIPLRKIPYGILGLTGRIKGRMKMLDSLIHCDGPRQLSIDLGQVVVDTVGLQAEGIKNVVVGSQKWKHRQRSMTSNPSETKFYFGAMKRKTTSTEEEET